MTTFHPSVPFCWVSSFERVNLQVWNGGLWDMAHTNLNISIGTVYIILLRLIIQINE